MTTLALTLADFSGDRNKFDAIKGDVTPEVLDLINRSETMKDLILSY